MNYLPPTMSEKIAADLRNWFLTLGFQDKNLSTDQIEAEFQRLSPPELRDIWRSIMVHVVPVKEARYIRKVVMLHELNKCKAAGNKKLLIPKHIRSPRELDQFVSGKDTYDKLQFCREKISKCEAAVNAMRTKIIDSERERQTLLQTKEKLDHAFIAIDLKINDHEKTIKDLAEIHVCLSYLNLFWQTEKNVREDVKEDLLEIIKDCLRNVNEFGQRANILTDIELAREKEILMNTILRLTCNIPVSSLYRTIIDMLKDTLSSLLKLSDHVNSRPESEHSWMVSTKLTELKKECVQYFLKNTRNREQLQTLRDKIQTNKSALLDAFDNNDYSDSQKEVFRNWLDSECEKHCMVTKENFLRKEYDDIKNKINKIVDFSNNEEKKLFFNDFMKLGSSTFVVEQEIANNICHLSDESINMFIKCQDYCTSRVELFIKEEQSEKLSNLAPVSRYLTNELLQLKTFDLPALSNDVAISDVNQLDQLSNYQISFCAEQCYYLMHLKLVYEKLSAKFSHPAVESEFLRKKQNQFKTDQEKFPTVLKKSIRDAKNNLKNVENYANECSKNIELWTKFSGNDIIPKEMMVDDRVFVDWFKRYVSVIQCLRKKTNKTANL